MTYGTFQLIEYFNIFYQNYKRGIFTYKAKDENEKNLYDIFKNALHINTNKYKYSQIEQNPNEFKDKVLELYIKTYKIENNIN